MLTKQDKRRRCICGAPHIKSFWHQSFYLTPFYAPVVQFDCGLAVRLKPINKEFGITKENTKYLAYSISRTCSVNKTIPAIHIEDFRENSKLEGPKFFDFRELFYNVSLEDIGLKH